MSDLVLRDSGWFRACHLVGCILGMGRKPSSFPHCQLGLAPSHVIVSLCKAWIFLWLVKLGHRVLNTTEHLKEFGK